MFGIILRILALAFTIALVGAWGIIKDQNKNSELLNVIYNKVEKKIIKLLKKNGKMSFKELKYEIDGVKGSLFWSKKKIKVTDSKVFTKAVLDKLLKENLIVKESKGKNEYYNLRSVNNV
ncbi:hypothetical protein [Helicovermis profundi]|uniref:Uncharacterized protein n=1 Tax=Helicovermis profundi TaxID=3065157 RepID=A0AAU9EGU8_9FIRM|nr:hypothetical protein HLPR_23180 [Clostridia bacterium S502]